MFKTLMLFFSLLICINLSYAYKRIEDKFINVKIITLDGKSKIGKVKSPLKFNKDIELIIDDNKENISNLDIKSLEIINENGVSITYDNVYAFKSFRNGKIEKKPRLMLVVVRGITTLYQEYIGQNFYSIGTGLGGQFLHTNYYAIREGEPAAALISAVISGQANPNAVFRRFAKDYFSDYPELAKKIEDKVYKYTDVLYAVLEYNNWKK